MGFTNLSGKGKDMPHIVIQLSGRRDGELARKTLEAVEGLTHAVLGKDRAVMASTVQFISAEDWYIGGVPLSETGKSAFFVEVSITDETNTKAEKARYLAEVFAAFQKLMPNLHASSYIHLVDARAAAYGYGGQSQEWRHQRAGV